MPYAAASDVYALARDLIAPASAFTASTMPASAQVDFWLSSGSNLIDARLASKGYGSIPVTSAAYGVAAMANALYGAWLAEDSKIGATIAPGERTRADKFKSDFTYHLEMLVDMDLGRMGVSRTSTVRATGISRSDKQTFESDGDRVPSRFARGMLKHPLRLDPLASTSAS